MWEYETRFGTFWICIDQPGICELWLEDERLGNYKNIEEASEAVRFYIQQENGADRTKEGETTEEDWIAYYDEFDEPENIEDERVEAEPIFERWHFQSEVGIFHIQANSVSMYDLRFNDICLGIYTKPHEAADAVARCETGYKKWDRRGPVEKPSSFSEWTAGSPEDR